MNAANANAVEQQLEIKKNNNSPIELEVDDRMVFTP